MTVSVRLLFLVVTWVGLQYAIVVFPDHTRIVFSESEISCLFLLVPLIEMQPAIVKCIGHLHLFQVPSTIILYIHHLTDSSLIYSFHIVECFTSMWFLLNLCRELIIACRARRDM